VEIPYYKPSPAIEFNKFIHLLEEEKGYKYRDMAGKYSKEAREERDLKLDEWLDTNGYAGKKYVLNKPEGSQEDWAKDSPEMALRVEINTKIRGYLEALERPYQDVWHWLLKNAFQDVRNGCEEFLSITLLNKPDWFEDENGDYPFNEEPNPEYVERVLQDIFEACKDSPAFDGEGINFYIWW
jgi:hypothetical protein